MESLVKTMTNDKIRTITNEELIDEAFNALSPYGITVYEFITNDIDEYTDVNLRDIWLMLKGVIDLDKCNHDYVEYEYEECDQCGDSDGTCTICNKFISHLG